MRKPRTPINHNLLFKKTALHTHPAIQIIKFMLVISSVMPFAPGRDYAICGNKNPIFRRRDWPSGEAKETSPGFPGGLSALPRAPIIWIFRHPIRQAVHFPKGDPNEGDGTQGVR